MKRAFLIFLSVLMAFSCCSCGDTGYSAADKNHSADELPFSMEIGGKEISLSRVSFFEIYADHSYTGYTIVSIDRENLTDDDLYWMTGQADRISKEIDVSTYVSSEENKLSSDMMHLLKRNYDDRYLYFLFCSDPVRYDLSTCEIRAQVVLSPDGKVANSEYYYYTLTTEESIDYEKFDHLSDNEMAALADAIAE